MLASALTPLAGSMWDHMDDGWGVFMAVAMVAFWVAIAVLLVWLVKRGPHSGDRVTEPRETAREILDRRFAEGVMDQSEYESRRRALLDREP